MAYSKEQVIAMCHQTHGGAAGLVASVGQGNGGGVASQHADAIQFWQLALACVNEGALPEGDRALCEQEIARHTAALTPPAVGSQHTVAV